MPLTLSRTRRIDYPRMVDNLSNLGMSMQEIADVLEVSRSSLDNWGRHECIGEPSGRVCITFLQLWCDRTRLSWTDIPVRTITPSVSEVLRTS